MITKMIWGSSIPRSRSCN